jgi:hypothetical protein
MKESYWGYWLILLGVFIIGIMMLVNSTTTNNTQDYYTLKEVTQASMVDALDFSYYRLYGQIKMSEQKFVENFVRRLADNTNLSNTYDVAFYDLSEVPPKVSVKMTTKSNSYNIANNQTNYDVVNKLDAIIEIGVDSSNYTKSRTTSCYFIISTNLMDYFNGKTVKGQGGTTTITDAQKSKYQTLYDNWSDKGSLASFKGALAKQFPDMASLGYDNLIGKYPEFKTWIDNGWITISHA